MGKRGGTGGTDKGEQAEKLSIPLPDKDVSELRPLGIQLERKKPKGGRSDPVAETTGVFSLLLLFHLSISLPKT